MQISLLIQTRTLFHWRKHYYGLWTHVLDKNILMLDLFQLLSSPDVNWWTGVVWIIVMCLSAVWTLILTAPIHCRASIAETLMQWHISTNLMKKQTHPNLGCPEDEHIFSKCSFLVELFKEDEDVTSAVVVPVLTDSDCNSNESVWASTRFTVRQVPDLITRRIP